MRNRRKRKRINTYPSPGSTTINCYKVSVIVGLGEGRGRCTVAPILTLFKKAHCLKSGIMRVAKFQLVLIFSSSVERETRMTHDRVK